MRLAKVTAGIGLMLLFFIEYPFFLKHKLVEKIVELLGYLIGDLFPRINERRKRFSDRVSNRLSEKGNNIVFTIFVLLPLGYLWLIWEMTIGNLVLYLYVLGLLVFQVLQIPIYFFLYLFYYIGKVRIPFKRRLIHYYTLSYCNVDCPNPVSNQCLECKQRFCKDHHNSYSSCRNCKAQAFKQIWNEKGMLTFKQLYNIKNSDNVERTYLDQLTVLS